jgi:EamA domain-containing membrane protein RarD
MIVYLIIATIYGIYSMMRQWQRYPDHAGFFKLFVVFTINFAFMPICLIIAIARKTLIPTKEEHGRFMLLLGFKKYRYKK